MLTRMDQFNCIKEMTLPEVAEAYQALGYNAILYDGRSVGESGGQHQNLVDPILMAEDLSDVYTYVTGLPSVDSNEIVLWGMSFGAVISSSCAAVDRRPKAVIMVCPLFTYVRSGFAEKAFAQVTKDRISQLRGNAPHSVVPFTPRGDNLIGLGGDGGLEIYNLMKAASEIGHPGFRNRIAMQTYRKLAMFRPMEYMDMLTMPVMMVIPELDNISPPHEQMKGFQRITSHKREYHASGKGHLNVVTGEGSQELIAATEQFIRNALHHDSNE
ncbi:MAG: hypothetical protein MMC23_009765 [Stictis urceolatum]|nr:hypothetical protein [Stictis urceolata]